MVWVLLNKHPQVLKRVIQELEQVIGKENVEVQHLYRLKYCRGSNFGNPCVYIHLRII